MGCQEPRRDPSNLNLVSIILGCGTCRGGQFGGFCSQAYRRGRDAEKFWFMSERLQAMPLSGQLPPRAGSRLEFWRQAVLLKATFRREDQGMQRGTVIIVRKEIIEKMISRQNNERG